MFLKLSLPDLAKRQERAGDRGKMLAGWPQDGPFCEHRVAQSREEATGQFRLLLMYRRWLAFETIGAVSWRRKSGVDHGIARGLGGIGPRDFWDCRSFQLRYIGLIMAQICDSSIPKEVQIPKTGERKRRKIRGALKELTR